MFLDEIRINYWNLNTKYYKLQLQKIKFKSLINKIKEKKLTLNDYQYHMFLLYNLDIDYDSQLFNILKIVENIIKSKYDLSLIIIMYSFEEKKCLNV